MWKLTDEDWSKEQPWGNRANPRLCCYKVRAAALARLHLQQRRDVEKPRVWTCFTSSLTDHSPHRRTWRWGTLNTSYIRSRTDHSERLHSLLSLFVNPEALISSSLMGRRTVHTSPLQLPEGSNLGVSHPFSTPTPINSWWMNNGATNPSSAHQSNQ